MCVRVCVSWIWKSLAMQCMVGVTRQHRMFEIFEVILKLGGWNWNSETV